MKIKNFVLKIVMCLVMLFSFSSCRKAPEEMCGRYNLTQISGVLGVSVSSYEYNYIELYDDYTYSLENKIYGTVTAQSGTWSYSAETKEITFLCKVNASTYSKDVAIYDEETKSFTISSTVENLTISMVMTLQVENQGE